MSESDEGPSTKLRVDLPMSFSLWQRMVDVWVRACFGDAVADDRRERCHRFLEEAFEQVQSLGTSRSEMHQLVDYVCGRPVGETWQEVGGVLVTLAALCNAVSVDSSEAAVTELLRVQSCIDKIRAKQAAKPRHEAQVALPSDADEEAVRVGFEAYLLSQDPSFRPSTYRTNGVYISRAAEVAWRCWREARLQGLEAQSANRGSASLDSAAAAGDLF